MMMAFAAGQLSIARCKEGGRDGLDRSARPRSTWRARRETTDELDQRLRRKIRKGRAVKARLVADCLPTIAAQRDEPGLRHKLQKGNDDRVRFLALEADDDKIGVDQDELVRQCVAVIVFGD